MTRDDLLAYSKRDLADLAKRHAIAGAGAMRKDDLVRALEPLVAPKVRKSGKSSPGDRPRLKVHAPVQAAAERNTPKRPPMPALELKPRAVAADGDRVVVIVRDAYWMQASWHTTAQAAGRAEAALGHHWHTAKKVLRVRELTGSSERVVRDIPIPEAAANWYVEVPAAGRSYRMDVGYLARNGEFYHAARSNTVTPPDPADAGADRTWAGLDAHDADRLLALSGDGSVHSEHGGQPEVRRVLEEHLARPIGAPAVATFGAGGRPFGGEEKPFTFHIDADLVIHGKTEPNARVVLQGQPVTIGKDGSFAMRFKQPDARQLIRAVVTSPDGFEERTVIIAIERNTKRFEPMLHDTAE